jgi:anthranilate/para-aminobenzoate synthase component I
MNPHPRDQVLHAWVEDAKNQSHATILWSAGYQDSAGWFEGLFAKGLAEVGHDWSVLGTCDERLRILSLAYDAKNDVEPLLKSTNTDRFNRPNFELIAPEHWEILLRDGDKINRESHLMEFLQREKGNKEQLYCTEALVTDWDNEVRLKQLNSASFPWGSSMKKPATESSICWVPAVSKAEYQRTIDWIKSNIVAGDFYELNYCISFEATADIDPYWVFWVMTQVSGSPMMCFVKRGDYYLLSSSMERYLLNADGLVISQPIKGTVRNTAGKNIQHLQDLGEELYRSEKDRAENVMIVDLVRNDLSRVCVPNTVKVPELCGIYAYPHVLQMVSTVVGQLREDVSILDVLKATFPMGSMTGAPKIAVMKHCEQLESFKRGMYSGSIGWVCGNYFDLNVVIRALQYQSSKNALQYAVGGAITIDSNAAEEYQECLAKAEAMLRTLQVSGYSISNL